MITYWVQARENDTFTDYWKWDRGAGEYMNVPRSLYCFLSRTFFCNPLPVRLMLYSRSTAVGQVIDLIVAAYAWSFVASTFLDWGEQWSRKKPRRWNEKSNTLPKDMNINAVRVRVNDGSGCNERSKNTEFSFRHRSILRSCKNKIDKSNLTRCFARIVTFSCTSPLVRLRKVVLVRKRAVAHGW